MKIVKCYRCKAKKPVTEFYKKRSVSTGHSYMCKACDRQRQWRTPDGRYRKFGFSPVEPRFWPKVQVCEHGTNCGICCWLWLAGKAGDKYLYGVIFDHGKQRKAGKVAWEIFYQVFWPLEKMMCHNCNNPPCVNPHHIKPGTLSDNMQDRKRAGNQPRGFKRRKHRD